MLTMRVRAWLTMLLFLRPVMRLQVQVLGHWFRWNMILVLAPTGLTLRFYLWLSLFLGLSTAVLVLILRSTLLEVEEFGIWLDRFLD